MAGMGVAGAIQLIGAAVAAYGAVSQGIAAKEAGDYNAAVATQNAMLARQSAAESERRERRLGAKRMGTLRVGQASLDLLEDAAMEEELEALTIRHQGEIQAIGFGRGAAIETARGRTALVSGVTGAAGTLLAGGAELATTPGLLETT